MLASVGMSSPRFVLRILALSFYPLHVYSRTRNGACALCRSSSRIRRLLTHGASIIITIVKRPCEAPLPSERQANRGTLAMGLR